MPSFDGTGQNGENPMTGHGDGYCALERKRRDGSQVLARIVGAAGYCGGCSMPGFMDPIRGGSCGG
jgi:hypothetical protein